jgi:predicted dehydrogenase
MAAAAGQGEPTVVAASAKLSSPNVDRWMQADVEFPGGASGRITCSLFSAQLLRIGVRVTGDDGQLSLFNPLQPKLFHRMVIRSSAGRRVEKVPGETTYTYQLRAFAAAARSGDTSSVLTPPSDAIVNMRVIDAIYDASGLGIRQPS